MWKLRVSLILLYCVMLYRMIHRSLRFSHLTITMATHLLLPLWWKTFAALPNKTSVGRGSSTPSGIGAVSSFSLLIVRAIFISCSRLRMEDDTILVCSTVLVRAIHPEVSFKLEVPSNIDINSINSINPNLRFVVQKLQLPPCPTVVAFCRNTSAYNVLSKHTQCKRYNCSINAISIASKHTMGHFELWLLLRGNHLPPRYFHDTITREELHLFRALIALLAAPSRAVSSLTFLYVRVTCPIPSLSGCPSESNVTLILTMVCWR